jgi:hypothetical protein
MVRDELRQEVVAVAEPAATVTLKGKTQGQSKLIGVGRTELCRVIDHADRLEQSGEQIKNND